MKLQIPKKYLINRVPPPPNFYKPDLTIDKTPAEKLDSLKVDIKTQPGEKDSDTVVIYVPMFRIGSLEDLLKFVTIPTKIIQGQDLSTGPQRFGTTRNPVVRETLRVFEKRLMRGAQKLIQNTS